ncbi:MAG: SDR family NAD(P)-dependent oxidoreductase [Chthonomonadaceae bacterium]|nr:SDR family NAD(P)-dependent oxidoreductase [Chthonomonadaceae bacterium]
MSLRLKRKAGKPFAIGADIADVSAVGTLFERLDVELTQRTGGATFDILVNNAGVANQIPFEETTEEQFDCHFDINVKGLFFTTQKSFSRLNDNGRIINVSSLVSRNVFPGIVAYASTKGAVDTVQPPDCTACRRARDHRQHSGSGRYRNGHKRVAPNARGTANGHRGTSPQACRTTR